MESQRKKDSCIHANSSGMLCWARALPAEDVPNLLAPIQMAGCWLGSPANKPREYICINTARHLPLLRPPRSLPRRPEQSSSSQNVIFRLLFRTCISVEHEVSQMLSWIASKEASISNRQQDKKNSVSGFWQLARKICWLILIFGVCVKRKNRWRFAFYLMQTLCSPGPFPYSCTLNFGGFSAKRGEFHNCNGMLQESWAQPLKLLPKMEKCQICLISSYLFSRL